MIDPELAARLDALEAKVDAAYKAADKVRKWIFWTGVVTVVLFVVPLIGLVFALPSFFNYYTQIGNYSNLIQ
ncbi:MAG: hypothetical protein ACREGR_05185 [Minisyncoccia bacterium]